MTHDEYREALALHAVGALDAAERRVIASHLQACARCTTELDDLRDTAASLGFLSRPIVPPAAHLERVLAALDVAEAPHPVARRPLGRGLRVAVACAMALLVVSEVALVRRLDRARREIDHMRAIGAFLTSPDVSVVPMAGRRMHAKLAFDRASGRFVFLSADLAPPPAGRRYQLWVIADGVQAAGVVISASTNGVLTTPTRDDALFLFAVSVEPEGDADAPTGPMVLMSDTLRNGP